LCCDISIFINSESKRLWLSNPKLQKLSKEFLPLSQSLPLFTLFFERFQAFSQMARLPHLFMPFAIKLLV